MEESWKQGVEYIRDLLIPEMVHDRCFCESGSREFVEFESVLVEPLIPRTSTARNELYLVKAVIRFSGVPKSFSLIVKLVSISTDLAHRAYKSFQNEELFYSKMTDKFGSHVFPKCYVSSMGRYERPSIVLEDLGTEGFVRVKGKLNDDHLKLCVETIGKFHGKGLKLKVEKFNVFREFSAKFLEVEFDADANQKYVGASDRILNRLKSMPDRELARKIEEKLGSDAYESVKNLALEVNEISTICHGHFSRDNVLFKYKNGRPVEIKVMNWERMRHCSIGIDLGPILFANLQVRNRVSKVEEMLKIYLGAVTSEFSVISYERLRKEFATKLLYTYVIVALDESTTNEELVEMLYQFQHFGLFD